VGVSCKPCNRFWKRLDRQAGCDTSAKVLIRCRLTLEFAVTFHLSQPDMSWLYRLLLTSKQLVVIFLPGSIITRKSLYV
jgi:hypothetical protein